MTQYVRQGHNNLRRVSINFQTRIIEHYHLSHITCIRVVTKTTVLRNRTLVDSGLIIVCYPDYIFKIINVSKSTSKGISNFLVI